MGYEATSLPYSWPMLPVANSLMWWPDQIFHFIFAVPCSLAKNWDQLVASFPDPTQLSVTFSNANQGAMQFHD